MTEFCDQLLAWCWFSHNWCYQLLGHLNNGLEFHNPKSSVGTSQILLDFPKYLGVEKRCKFAMGMRCILVSRHTYSQWSNIHISLLGLQSGMLKSVHYQGTASHFHSLILLAGAECNFVQQASSCFQLISISPFCMNNCVDFMLNGLYLQDKHVQF